MSVKSARAYYVLEILLAILIAAVAGSTAKGASIEQTFNFSKSQLQFNTVDGYDLVRLKDAGYLTDFGKPQMPVRELRVALPAGMRAETIEIVSETHVDVDGSFNILPSQKPLTVNDYDSPSDFIPADQAVYKSKALYPAEVATLTGQTDLAGQAIALVSVTPLQYSPAERKLTLTTSITIRISGPDDYVCGDYLSPAASEKTTRNVKSMLEAMVVNSQDVQLVQNRAFAKSAALPTGGPFDHLIITSADLADDYADIAFWHNRKGVRDTVITTDYIYANYTGADNPEKIRNFVIDAYNTWGTSYILMGGENGNVPFKYKSYVSESIPSDEYYGDFDDDWSVETNVGRVTASNATEVARFTAKLMKYETDPPGLGYALNATFVGMDLTTASEPPNYTLTAGEALKNFIDTTYVPNRFTVDGIYDSQASNHRVDFFNAFNAGTHLINHCDHSNITIMGLGDRNHNWYMGNGDVDGFTNDGELSVIFSLGCDPNEMDYNDCIAEHFVIYNDMQGAVAFTGNTRSGWFYIGDPLSLSNELDYKWWEGLFDNNQYHIGAALAYSKNNTPANDSYWRYVNWTLNLLGEPEMPIWTDLPTRMMASFDDTVSVLPYDYTVTVTTTHGGPIADAYVCVWAPGYIYQTGYTDAGGEATFNLTGASSGPLYVTATKQNVIPFLGEATLQVTNQAPECQVPNDTSVLVRDGDQICLPVGCYDPDGNLLPGGPTIVSGPGEIVDGQWCHTPTEDDVCNVTIRCEDDGGLFCESSFQVTCDHYLCGDADGDGIVNISDAVALINYIFGDQFAPSPLVSGDADCDGLVNISDAVRLINYIFSDAPPPCSGC